jgi:uncharacterized protein
MFRAVLFLIAIVLIISLLRSVIGIIAKSFSGLATPPAPSPHRPDVPSGGELKKDPVCGTFIAATTAHQKKVGGVIYYFCSAECRDKFG